MLIFQNTLPSLGAGRLRLRGEDARVYGTDKEHTLRVPEDPFYKQMAADFSKFQIAVNIYVFSDKYTDIATLGLFLFYVLPYEWIKTSLTLVYYLTLLCQLHFLAYIAYRWLCCFSFTARAKKFVASSIYVSSILNCKHLI